MRNDEKKRILWTYVLAIALPLAVGGLAALLTGGGMRDYGNLNKPSLSPPGWIFPLVWTALFILMGIGSGQIWLSGDDCRRDALEVYGLQLFLNFGWTILFFGFHWYLAAFAWLVVLEGVIVVMIALFYAARPLAAYLQIPYFLWVAFAGYLNLGTYLLN